MPDTAPATAPEKTDGELRAELGRFKEALRAGGLRESTLHSYLMGSTLFVRWLAGDYAPGPRRADHPPARDARAPS